MKTKAVSIFWGVVLVLVGCVLLAQALGTIRLETFPSQGWAAGFGVAAALFLVSYGVSGFRKWGWLFPTLFCAVASVWIAVDASARSTTRGLLNGLSLVALAVPFYVGYALDRKRRGLLTPAYALSMAALVVGANAFASGIRLTVGFPRMTLSGSTVLLVLATPFLAAYLWSPAAWWALIPAGGLSSMALTLVTQRLFYEQLHGSVSFWTGSLLLGFASTFTAVWLRHKTQPVAWAKFPAIGLAVLSVAAFLLGNGWTTLSDQVMAIVFAVASGAFLLGYALSGIRKWGWLVPACACAGMALLMWMETDDTLAVYSAVPFLAGLTLPFCVGYALNRRIWGLLVPAYAGVVIIVTVVLGNTNSTGSAFDISGAAFMFMMALPWFVAYAKSAKNWWALMPGGVSASIAVVVVLEAVAPSHSNIPFLGIELGAYSSVMFAGLAATFSALWLRRGSQPTGWAVYPAAGMLVCSALTAVPVIRYQLYWPAIPVLALGAMLLVSAFTPSRATTTAALDRRT